jgi:hypothetical protein
MAGTSPTDEIRSLMYRMLLDKVRNDHFPSGTMMDMIESCSDDRIRQEYMQELIDKVSDDSFPSITMIRRVLALR